MLFIATKDMLFIDISRGWEYRSPRPHRKLLRLGNFEAEHRWEPHHRHRKQSPQQSVAQRDGSLHAFRNARGISQT